MEFEKKANELYNTMKNTNWDTLTEQAKMYLQQKLQWDRNRVTVWNPDGIEFQVILCLRFKMDCILTKFRTFSKFFQFIYDDDKIHIIIFTFQAEMYIPVEIRDLQSLPRPNVQRYISRARNWVKTYLPEDGYQLYDTLYKYKPSPDPYNWVPPFKSKSFSRRTMH